MKNVQFRPSMGRKDEEELKMRKSLFKSRRNQSATAFPEATSKKNRTELLSRLRLFIPQVKTS